MSSRDPASEIPHECGDAIIAKPETVVGSPPLRVEICRPAIQDYSISLLHTAILWFQC